jgi:hypothetical protein
MPSPVDAGPGVLAEVMNARSIAEFVRKIRHHCFDHTRIDRRRSTVVEVKLGGKLMPILTYSIREKNAASKMRMRNGQTIKGCLFRRPTFNIV